MDQPPHNHNVGVGGHHSSASLSSSGPTTFHSAPSSGERSSGSARRMGHLLVTSAGDAEESQTPDQGTPAMSEDAQHLSFAQQTLPQPTSEQFQLYDTLLYIENGMISTGPEAVSGSEFAQCFLHASLHPPVTPESLAELDMPRIINNPKLRQDVNFDRELHFRPNLDGSKGRIKLQAAEDYWKALEAELYLYGLVHGSIRDLQGADSEAAAHWQGILGCSQKRLARLFQNIRDILKTLVPDCDQKSIEDRLDVELIMREILNGMFDLIGLASWLAKIIKNHCAPMRDHLVDAMQAEIKLGACEEKPTRLVNGIRQLLDILEAMKLDVANHQIRHMRPLLVDDTVNFQRRYNQHRISLNKIDVPRSRAWLESELTCITNPTNPAPTRLEALTSALMHGLTFSESFSAAFPATFYLDHERLRYIRNDLHLELYQLICKEVLFELTDKQASQAELDEAAASIHCCVEAILCGGPGRIGNNIENIAAEIMRVVLITEGKEGQTDLELLDFAQQRLEEDLRTASPTFKKYGHEMVGRLLPKLQKSVDHYARMPMLHVQDRLVPRANLPAYTPFGFGAVCGPAMPAVVADPDDELIRRFTHVLVLHWQVWSELAYIPPPPVEGVGAERSNTPPASGSNSPTVPVAQAVYAPGRKWLPIGVTVTEVPSQLPTPAATPAADSQSQSDSDDESDGPVHSGASRNST